MGGVEKLHKKFDIHKIERDDALQARVKLDHKVVNDYAGKMKNGTEFPPLVLFQEGEGAGLDHGAGHPSHSRCGHKYLKY